MSTNNEPFATVKLSKLKRVIAAWEAIKCKDSDEDVDVTIEYLIVSCFPDLWKKFQDNIRDQYTRGYMAGVKDTEDFYQNGPKSHEMVEDNESNA